MENMRDLVMQAQAGDLEAYGRLVQATQAMAFGVAVSVLRDSAIAQDATQEAYLRAFRRLRDLEDPATFAGWLRRIVITVALNMRRARRRTLLCLDDVPTCPVLDETETRWSDVQRHRLARALLTLTPEERQLCDRRYHGRWSTARLAHEAGVDEAAMRKRLQRIRDKLRKEIEMAEQRAIRADEIRPDLPAKVVELLARPRLTDLPENPVGQHARAAARSCMPVSPSSRCRRSSISRGARRRLPTTRSISSRCELHRVDDRRILRYDLTLPLLLTVRYDGQPLRIWASGKAYRQCQVDATHLEAFHQAEVLWLDERSRLDPWQVTGPVLQSVDRVLPGAR